MPTNLRVLTLHLKRKWWEQIKAGTKTEELRQATAYNVKLIGHGQFDVIAILLGYPKKTDASRRLEFYWKGYTMKSVIHEEFGAFPREVIAIDLSAPVTAAT
jgi:hypothetical protein